MHGSMHHACTPLTHRPTVPKYTSWKLLWHLVHMYKHWNQDRPPTFSRKHQQTDLEKSHTITTLQWTLRLLVIFAYKTFHLQDTSPAGHFAYCTVCLLFAHFAYKAVHQLNIGYRVPDWAKSANGGTFGSHWCPKIGPWCLAIVWDTFWSNCDHFG